MYDEINYNNYSDVTYQYNYNFIISINNIIFTVLFKFILFLFEF